MNSFFPLLNKQRDLVSVIHELGCQENGKRASEPPGGFCPSPWKQVLPLGTAGRKGAHICEAQRVPDAWLHQPWEEGDALLLPFCR